MASITNSNSPQQRKGQTLPAGRGLKQAPPGLAEFIRLANLVPEGTWLPPELLPNLNTLTRTPDGKLQGGGTWAELLERIQDLPEAVRAELIEWSRVQPAPEDRVFFDRDPDGYRFDEVLMHYEKIRTAYNNLRGLTRGTASLDPLENLLHALLYADVEYLRRCPKEDCGKIFYAGKRTQVGCIEAHSDAVRKKNKRERDKLNRQNAKKRAKTASKR